MVDAWMTCTQQTGFSEKIQTCVLPRLCQIVPDCARLSACLMPRTCDPHTHVLVSKTPTVGSGLLGHFSTGSLIITVLLHVERTLPVFLDWYQMVMKSSSSLKYRCFFQLRDLIFLIIAPTSMAWRLSSP